MARLQAVREEITAVMAPMLVTRRSTGEAETLRRLRSEEEELKAALSHRGALHRPGLDTVTLAEVQARLEPNEVLRVLLELLHYRRFDPARTGRHDPWKEARYAAVVLPASGDLLWFDLGEAAAIDDAVDRWRRLLRDSRSDLGELDAAGAALYGALFAPLRSAVGNAGRLLVSPDGKLALIPFGLLRGPDGALQDRCTVSYLSSGRDLVRPLAPAARLQIDVVELRRLPRKRGPYCTPIHTDVRNEAGE